MLFHLITIESEKKKGESEGLVFKGCVGRLILDVDPRRVRISEVSM